jgi:8-amino-7-oxononanoate synthase
MDKFIREELKKLEEAGLKRGLRTIEGPQGPRVTIDGRELLLLCSNDYLGLANHPEVKAAAMEAIQRYGFGAGASRLVSGSMAPHRELEERLSAFKSAEAALLFNSGYNANLALVTTLAGRETEIFSDRLNHASIVDACVLSRARVRRYANADADSLERLLKRSHAERKLVITEGVFSMDGNVAPLKDILSLADRYGATLILDDAHATGVLGPGGRGTLEHFGLDRPDVIHMGTLGKALGAFGAFVAGPRPLIELLISKARPFIYTTALPPAVAAAAVKAIEIVERSAGLRERLWENAAHLREGLNAAGLDTFTSSTQIIPILTGGPATTMEASRKLFERGLFIQGIRPPTVPQGTGRLRVTVTAAHTTEEITGALTMIREVFAEMGQTVHA